jgi:hypothetical protein
MLENYIAMVLENKSPNGKPCGFVSPITAKFDTEYFKKKELSGELKILYDGPSLLDAIKELNNATVLYKG